jgi:hypothetical protein
VDKSGKVGEQLVHGFPVSELSDRSGNSGTAYKRLIICLFARQCIYIANGELVSGNDELRLLADICDK